MSIDEQIPDAELPDLPGELCGIWSYIKWEHAGCPNRTEQESQAAYREAIEVTFSFPLCSSYLLQLGAVQKTKSVAPVQLKAEIVLFCRQPSQICCQPDNVYIVWPTAHLSWLASDLFLCSTQLRPLICVQHQSSACM